jgi:hypothetical protein
MEMMLALNPLLLLHHWPLPFIYRSPGRSQWYEGGREFHSQLHKSMQFRKSTTVMPVMLTHYMKLNTIGTISCSIKTDNSYYVQIYSSATYKITNTKETPKQRTLLFQNIMAKGRTMFRVLYLFLSRAKQTQTELLHDLLYTETCTYTCPYKTPQYITGTHTLTSELCRWHSGCHYPTGHNNNIYIYIYIYCSYFPHARYRSHSIYLHSSNFF